MPPEYFRKFVLLEHANNFGGLSIDEIYSHQDLIIYLANLLYDINLNVQDIKVFWKNLISNKENQENFDISKSIDGNKLTEEEKVVKNESTVGDNRVRSNSSPKWLNAFKSLNLFSLTVLVIGVLVLLGIGVYAITTGDEEEGPTIDSNLIQHQIETVSELTTTKYHYTNAAHSRTRTHFTVGTFLSLRRILS